MDNPSTTSDESANVTIYSEDLDTLSSLLVTTLDLTPNEAKIYLIMLSQPEFTALQLSKEANLPRARVYKMLKSLENKEMIVVVSESPKLYAAISPKKAIKSRLNNLASALEERKQRALSISEMLDGMHKSFHHNNVLPGLVLVPLQDAINEIVQTLKQTTKRVYLAVTPRGGVVHWEGLRQETFRLLNQNCEVRFLVSKNDRFVQSLSINDRFNIQSSNSQIRYNPDLKISFALLDNMAFTFFIRTHRPKTSFVQVTSHTDYIEFLEQVFNLLWEKSQPINLE